MNTKLDGCVIGSETRLGNNLVSCITCGDHMFLSSENRFQGIWNMDFPPSAFLHLYFDLHVEAGSFSLGYLRCSLIVANTSLLSLNVLVSILPASFMITSSGSSIVSTFFYPHLSKPILSYFRFYLCTFNTLRSKKLYFQPIEELPCYQKEIQKLVNNC